uniref:DUF5641 domain-containing protein n=1 Tax=Strigamia maritima TaxID=126957 RepID=T1JN08_STRMM
MWYWSKSKAELDSNGRRGRITEVRVGKDGKVRSCELITSNGTKLRRPIQRLVHLEIQSDRGTGEVSLGLEKPGPLELQFKYRKSTKSDDRLDEN